jgi:hypothetical protein
VDQDLPDPAALVALDDQGLLDHAFVDDAVPFEDLAE